MLSAHWMAAAQLSSSIGVSLESFSVRARMKLAPKAGPMSFPERYPPIVESVLTPCEPKAVEGLFGTTLTFLSTKSYCAMMFIEASA